MNQVSANYLTAMGIPLLAGRVFDDRDVKGSPKVIIIDEILPREDFPSETRSEAPQVLE